jgi:ribonuclease-3
VINSLFRFIRISRHPKNEFYKALRVKLGFYPRKIEYYEQALIHKSVSLLAPDGTVVNNERLEFLGDAILDAVVGDFLFHKFPKGNEGFLTQMRSKIVNGENLSELAKKIGINHLIKAQINNTKGRTKIYEDAFEAFIGAVYLDQGFIITKNFIIERILKTFVDVKELKDIDTNYKSQLIEWGQKYKKEISFTTDLESENSKLFISYVLIDNKSFGSGVGMSKKLAEQNAAKATLELVVKDTEPSNDFDKL